MSIRQHCLDLRRQPFAPAPRRPRPPPCIFSTMLYRLLELEPASHRDAVWSSRPAIVLLTQQDHGELLAPLSAVHRVSRPGPIAHRSCPHLEPIPCQLSGPVQPRPTWRHPADRLDPSPRPLRAQRGGDHRTRVPGSTSDAGSIPARSRFVANASLMPFAPSFNSSPSPKPRPAPSSEPARPTAAIGGFAAACTHRQQTSAQTTLRPLQACADHRRPARPARS